MRKSVSSMIAIVVAVVMSASAAWAGGVASVNQSGDNGIALVFQKKGITVSSNLNVKSPVVHYVAGRQIEKLAGKLAATASNDNSGSCAGRAPRRNNVLLMQSGLANSAIISQSGRGNTSTIQQAGTNNSSYVIQSGSGHHAETIQSGNNNIALVVQRC